MTALVLDSKMENNFSFKLISDFLKSNNSPILVPELINIEAIYLIRDFNSQPCHSEKKN